MAHPGTLHHHWVAVDGLRVRSLVSAAGRSGPPLVFVHAFGLSSDYLRDCMRLLADPGAYAPELPGFGFSDDPPEPLDIPGLADALARWIQGRHLAPVVLVGNSLGCQVAASLAARHPQLVRGLVLTSPPLQPGSRSVPEAIARFLLNLRRERPAFMALTVRSFVLAGLRTLLGTLGKTVHYPLERDLPRVSVPALVVHGRRDAIVERDWCRQVAALLPRGELTELAESAHAIPHNSPTQLASLIRAFLLRV